MKLKRIKYLWSCKPFDMCTAFNNVFVIQMITKRNKLNVVVCPSCSLFSSLQFAYALHIGKIVFGLYLELNIIKWSKECETNCLLKTYGGKGSRFVVI